MDAILVLGSIVHFCSYLCDISLHMGRWEASTHGSFPLDRRPSYIYFLGCDSVEQIR